MNDRLKGRALTRVRNATNAALTFEQRLRRIPRSMRTRPNFWGNLDRYIAEMCIAFGGNDDAQPN